MTRLEAAHRLGVAEHLVLTVQEHPAGHLATLRSGVVMLVSETTARVYLPEVDDPRPELVGEDGPELTKLPVAAEVVKPVKAAPKRKSAGGSGS